MQKVFCNRIWQLLDEYCQTFSWIKITITFEIDEAAHHTAYGPCHYHFLPPSEVLAEYSPWVFSIKMTLESELKFCPVKIICWPPRTEQLSMSCFSTIGSSWADRWAVGRKREHDVTQSVVLTGHVGVVGRELAAGLQNSRLSMVLWLDITHSVVGQFDLRLIFALNSQGNCWQISMNEACHDSFQNHISSLCISNICLNIRFV